MSAQELEDIGQQVVELARRLGADEVTARVSRSASTELTQRDGQLEKSQESRSLSVRASLLVDGRYSSHATSDTRPEALEGFLRSAVAATRFLEQDPHRGLPERERMGEAEADLDQVDPGWHARDPRQRREAVEALEAAATSTQSPAPVRSISAYVWDGYSERAMVCSNGFSASESSTTFGHGAMATLEDEGGRLPEAYSFYSTRHLDELPAVDEVTGELMERAGRRLKSGPTKSGRYTMLLENRVVGRLLRVLLGPMSGTAIYEGRSCLADKLGQRIADPRLSIWDDPLIPRASGSQLCDGDGIPARRRPILVEGVLERFLVGVYNGRRLGVEPTTASTSNLVIEPGDQGPLELAADQERAILVQGFLGGNSNPASGDFSFGIQGVLLEHGEPVANLSEMNISGDLLELLAGYRAAGNDVWRYGSWRVPTLRFDDVQFSGS